MHQPNKSKAWIAGAVLFAAAGALCYLYYSRSLLSYRSLEQAVHQQRTSLNPVANELYGDRKFEPYEDSGSHLNGAGNVPIRSPLYQPAPPNPGGGLAHNQSDGAFWITSLSEEKQQAVAGAFAEHASALRANLGQDVSSKSPDELRHKLGLSQADLFRRLMHILDAQEYTRFVSSLPNDQQESALRFAK